MEDNNILIRKTWYKTWNLRKVIMIYMYFRATTPPQKSYVTALSADNRDQIKELNKKARDSLHYPREIISH